MSTFDMMDKTNVSKWTLMRQLTQNGHTIDFLTTLP